MARQTLTMAITLEGADKVEADLSKLGPAAEKAFKKIKDAADKAGSGFDKGITGAVRRFQQQILLLQAAGQRLGRAFGTFKLAADAFGASILTTAKRIGLLGGAIGGAITVVGAFASRTADNAERIDNQAKSLGISAQAFQVFETAAKNAGIEGATFDKIMAKFVTTAAEAGGAAGEAAAGANELAAGLRQVEVVAEDGSKKLITIRGTSDAFAKSVKTIGAASKGTEQDLIDFARRVTAIEDPLERIRAIMAAGFSKREAITAATFFRAIANDADALARSASRTVGPLSDLEIAIGVKLADAFDRFRTNIFRTKERLVTLFAPAITQAVEHFADLIFNNQKVLEDWANFIKDKAVPIVQDFINALTGNDEAVENKTIIAFRDAVIEFGKAVKFIIFDVVVPAFRFLLRVLDGVAAGINAVFGTNLSGASIIAVLFVAKIVRAFSLLHSAINLIILTFNVLGTAVSALRFAGLIGRIGSVTGAILGLSIATVDAQKKLEELSGVKLPTMAITPVIANPPTAPLLLILTYWSDLRKAVRDYFGLIDDSGEPIFAGFVAATSRAFEEVKTKASEAFATIKTKFSDGSIGRSFLEAESASFNALWEIIKTGALQVAPAIGPALQDAFTAIGTGASTAFSSIVLAAQQLQIQLAPIWTAISAGAASIWASVTAAIADGAASAFATIGPVLSSLQEQLTAGAQSALDAIIGIFSEGGIGAAFLAAEQASFNALWASIRTGAAGAFEFLRSTAESVINAISGFVTSLIGKIKEAISAIKSLASSRSGSNSSSDTGGGSGFAQGGQVRGSGTSTSDNIPAWLSPGEFVIRAAAVRKWGASFFAALNGLRMPKGGIGMKLGGLATSMSHGLAPRFAGGGPVETRTTSTGRPLTLVVDNQEFRGLTAPEDTVQQIIKFATGKKLRSNGRKPGWVGA